MDAENVAEDMDDGMRLISEPGYTLDNLKNFVKTHSKMSQEKFEFLQNESNMEKVNKMF